MTRSTNVLALVLCLAIPGIGAADEGADDLTDRMAAAHEGDAPVPAAAADDEAGTAAVPGQPVAYHSADGTEVTGWLAGDSGPGLIVIHEWWGLNDNVRAMTEKLAGAGYTALAVDLYDGASAEDREGARALMSAAMESPDRVLANLRAARAYLAETLGRTSVGVIGWCFGGGWSLATAVELGDGIDAAVVYYGRVITEAAELASLSAPVLGHFGALDQGIPLDGVRAFEAAAEEAGKEVTVHVYEGADHAFGNPSGTRYEPQAARLAWQRTLEFFDEHLGR